MELKWFFRREWSWNGFSADNGVEMVLQSLVLTHSLKGLGCKTNPIWYDRGSTSGRLSLSSGSKWNRCTNAVAKRNSLFLARTSPRQTRLPAPKGSSLRRFSWLGGTSFPWSSRNRDGWNCHGSVHSLSSWWSDHRLMYTWTIQIQWYRSTLVKPYW